MIANTRDRSRSGAPEPDPRRSGLVRRLVARVPGGSLSRDSIVYGIGGSATQVVYALFVPIFTRVFRPADFGVLESLVALNSLLGVAALIGMNSALFYFVRPTDSPDHRRRASGTALSIGVAAGVLVAAIGVLAAVPLSTALLQRPGYAAALALACLWVPANVAATLALDLLRLEFRPVAYSVIGIGRALVASVLGIVLAGPLRLGVAGLLAAHAVTTAIAAGAALVLARTSWKPWPNRRLAREMLRFGVPLATFGVALWVIAFSDRFFVIQFLGTAAAGVYALASRGAGVLSLVLFAFEAAWLPYAMARAGEPHHRAIYARTFAAVGVGLIGLATFLSLFAREALFVIATPEYVPAYAYVGPLAMAVAVYGLGQVVGIGIQLGKRTSALLAISALGAGANVVLNIVLIPRLGISGAAISTLFAYTLSTTLVFLVSERAYHVAYPVARVATAAAVGGGAIAMGIALDNRLPAEALRPETTGLKVVIAATAGVALWAIHRGRRTAATVTST